MFNGLSAFPITPATAEGRIDTDALQKLLARLVEAGVDSIGLLGSTGAYPFFTRDERRRAVSAAVECVAGRVKLLVGVGALRTDAAVMLAEDAKAAGADAGLLAPVSYTPLLDAEVLEHFRAVAAAGLPLCIYNNPGTTHFDVSPELVGRLAEVPGVAAVKTGAPAAEQAVQAVAALRSKVPEAFSVGFSVDWNAAGTMMAGADAWYSVVAGIYPKTFLRLARAAAAKDAAETKRLQEYLEPIWRLSRAYSSFRLVHLAATRAGIANAVPQRPLLPLSGEAAAEAERVLEELALD
jgi:4-hydroxy-tetrahydrodipicolinate synthase